MFYWLASFKGLFSLLNVFRYISFRTIGAAFTAFILTFFFLPKWMAYFKKKNFTAVPREENLKRHYEKTSCPTAGGIVLVPSLIITAFLWMKLNCQFTYIITFMLLILGILGLIDDILKIKKNSSKGINARQKLVVQIALGLLLGFYLWKNPVASVNVVQVPFLKDVSVQLGIFYIFFCALILAASSNAVNLTDGLDGLAIGSIMTVAFTLAILAYIAGNFQIASYLKFIYVKDAGELTVFLGGLLGGGLAFLWYNAHPAEIFMGDSGALALGGILGVISILIKQEFLLIFAGGVFVIEALSVIIQVLYFRKTGKRIFKMAPLHHHFEFKNWAESKIVIRFWIAGIFFAMIALMTLKIR